MQQLPLIGKILRRQLDFLLHLFVLQTLSLIIYSHRFVLFDLICSVTNCKRVNVALILQPEFESAVHRHNVVIPVQRSPLIQIVTQKHMQGTQTVNGANSQANSP